MSRKFLSLMLVLVMVLPAFSALGFETLTVPTEVRYLDRPQAYDGYTLFPSRGISYLIDLDGRLVHTWTRGSSPKLLDNGNILDRGMYDIMGGTGFQEVDWNSTVVWNYVETRPDYNPHHDFNRIFNPKLNEYTTIYIANKNITSAQVIAAGANPANGPYNGAQMDCIVEVAMNGTVVWEWWFYDHLVQDIDPAKANYVGAGKTISDYPGRLNINLPGKPVRADWLHCNALDYNQALDQIVVDCVNGELYVIDHGGTFIPGDPNASIALAASGAGDFIYRFGDPARYGRGDPPAILEDWTCSTTGHKQLGGAHDVQWIRDGLPGAGHFLVFNNGQFLYEKSPQSYVMEIDPFLDAGGTDTGNYVDPPSAGYRLVPARDPVNSSKQDRLISNQVVWIYGSKSTQDLYDQIGCSAQRLPNGNTLICSCAQGRIFEVTYKGDIVWEYVNPDSAGGISKVRPDGLPMISAMFRAYRFGKDHPAFAGRTLSPGDPLTGPVQGPDFRPAGGATETFYLDTKSTLGGYTLFAANGSTYLIDMEGRLVNKWNIGANPRLLDNGTLLDAASKDLSDLKEIQMVDWNGTVLWKYAESRPGYLMHHDFVMAPSPATVSFSLMYLASKPVTAEEALAAGCDPAHGPYDGARTDGIVEVDLNGTIIWEWWFIDHGIQDIDPAKANYVGAGKNLSDHPGRINLNLPGRPLGKSWLDANSIDYNMNLDQVVINSELGEFYIVDHGGTFVALDSAASVALAAGPRGDFLYRFGDPARYNRGAHPSVNADWTTLSLGNKQIGGSSDVHWIGTGLPGEGNLLVFNNAQYFFDRTAQSYVFEVDPFRNATGNHTGAYVDPPDAGYSFFMPPFIMLKAPRQLSKQVVWKYFSMTNLAFFSYMGSSAQRLPNGNLLVCSMTEGHLFEVKSNGTPVWEYINPVTAGGTFTQLYDKYPMTNPVFRAIRYAPGSHPLRGHDLTPKGTITGAPPHYITPVDLNMTIVSPVVHGTQHRPARPTPADSVFVTTGVQRTAGLASVTLTYNATRPGRAPQETMVFRETMAERPSRPWDGTGADNPWSVTAREPADVGQSAEGNFGEGNPCGLDLATGTGDLDGTAVETAFPIDARGDSGYVDFKLWAGGLRSDDGWTFQLDSGSGYVTRQSELSGANHDWLSYRYDLQDGERVAGLGMRFQFRAGHEGAGVRLDQIYVNVSSANVSAGTAANVPMVDDGLHGDGLPGDGVYGAIIPAFPELTRVNYYIKASAVGGATTLDPAGAPKASRSYTVGKGVVAETSGPLPDTGQAGDYTGTFGEDSDYTANAPTLADNGDGTVTDLVTGLRWQKADGGEMTWEAARAYADGLVLGGFGDWRLPSSHELFNLADFGRHDPALDTAFFTGSPAQYYWSADALAGNGSRIWAAGADGTIDARQKNDTVSAGGTGRFHGRCVRDGNAGTAPSGRFTDNGDGTATAAATGLVWQRAQSPANLTWEGALAYCEGLVLGGHDDWRLPNVKELRSLSNDTLSMPSANPAVFTGTVPSAYWTSTTDVSDPARAWYVDFGYGRAGADGKGQGFPVRAVRGQTSGAGLCATVPETVSIPGGTFVMGDHSGFGGAENSSDELPLHEVTVDGFGMGRFEVTNAQYCGFLQSALGQGTIKVAADGVFSSDGLVRYCDISSPNTTSRIGWDGGRFYILDGRMAHPATGVRWEGAAAYCNWLGVSRGFAALYDLRTGACNMTAAGYRLPTEAEWEYAALGGLNDTYPMFPWGNDADSKRANWPESSDPYENGTLPWTTPVGFYNGSLRRKSDLGWPGGQAAYQTGNGSNGYGLQDMSGNAWEWVNDLYNRDYYAVSTWVNPAGADTGTLMPDGKAHHSLRGGSWHSGEYGYARIADRESGYASGPQDPAHPYIDAGFRVALAAARQPGVAVGPGAALLKLADTGGPAEGPAADDSGNLYFTIPAADRIQVWSLDGRLSVFQNGTGGAVGLGFGSDGALVACEAAGRRLTRIDVAHPAASTVLTAMFGGRAFNGPDDLWIDPKGGIYFTDPAGGNGTAAQDGECVYYLAPNASAATRVVSDMLRPGGLAGTPDGRTLYVSDAGAGKTYRYTVLGNGSLSAKELFVPLGSGGITLDALGNVYLLNRTVLVFGWNGTRIDEIAVPDRPTNLEFGGSGRHTLFITAEKGLYGIRMAMQGTSNFKPRLFINEIKLGNETAPNGTVKPVFWVELYNNGTAPADLGGMYLTNDLSRPTAWRIPAGTTLGPGGFLVIWADNGWTQGPLHASFWLDPAGGVVGLLMPNGLTLIDSLSFGPQSANASWGRYPDGTDRFILMHDHPSPGGPNVPDDIPGGNGTHPGTTPPAVTIEGRTAAYILIAVVATIAVVTAGLYVNSRRKNKKEPEAGGG